MKSGVEHYLDFDEIILPEKYLTIPIPSWEAVIAPVLEGVLQDYANSHPLEEKPKVINDRIVAALNIPDLQTVADLKAFAMESFTQRAKERKFQEEVYPALLVFFANTSQTIINEEERLAYRQALLDNYQEEADRLGETYDDFIRKSFGVEPDNQEAIYEQIDEFFIYKLVANQRYKDKYGLEHEVDQLDYDSFIQSQVINQGVDEIDLRDRLPFEYYRDMYPEILLTEELQAYFKDQMKVVIQEGGQTA
ncbi:TPA: hypothetical protein ACGO1T_000952 [Streptococcus suis]